MKYCNKCKITITGNSDKCPLCGGLITDGAGDGYEKFPYIPSIYHRFQLFFKILLLVSVVAVGASVIINMAIPTKTWWSAFVVAGIVCGWISLAVAVNKRGNIHKTMLWQAILIIILSIIWDIGTGWHGWSINFVIPITCIFVMITMTVLAKARKQYIEDYFIYVFIDSLFGIVPLVLIVRGMLSSIYPSLICVLVSLVCLTFFIIFEGKNMMQELKKRFHI